MNNTCGWPPRWDIAWMSKEEEADGLWLAHPPKHLQLCFLSWTTWTKKTVRKFQKQHHLQPQMTERDVCKLLITVCAAARCVCDCAPWATWKHGVRFVNVAGRRLCSLRSTYTAVSRLGSPGSWCRAAGPAEGPTPGKSPAAAACWRPRTRTSWPSTSAVGAPSADATWCLGTGSWCTWRGGLNMIVNINLVSYFCFDRLIW